MNARVLVDTATALVAGDKGLLAMDESDPTCNKRFAKLGIPQTVVPTTRHDASGLALSAVAGAHDSTVVAQHSSCYFGLVWSHALAHSVRLPRAMRERSVA